MTDKKSFLNRRIEQDKRNILFVGIFYGIAVYLLLVLLQPFGIDGSGTAKYFELLLFALVTWLGVVGSHFILKLVSKEFFDAENWTIKKEIVFNLAVVGVIVLGNFVAFIVLYNIPITPRGIFTAGWQTLAIATCVIGLRVILGQKKSAETSAQASPTADNEPIRISGSGKNDLLSIAPSELLYIESDKNYCNIVTPAQKLQIRLTMSSAEEQLAGHPMFVRCHRAFIVNKSKIIRLDGNSTIGYKLQLSGTDDLIPVSRTYLENIADFAQNKP